MILELKFGEINLIGGGRCNCGCIFDEEYEYHHKKKTHQVTRDIGEVDNTVECTKVCATLPNGKVWHCTPIDDVRIIQGGIVGQLPPLRYGH
jgi:hypothetical protein